jgi:peptidoglycan/LPS O-acetylase OafA/YrhL
MPRRFFLGVVLVSLLTFTLMLARLAPSGLFFDGMWLQFAAGVGVYYWVNYASRPGRVLLPALLLSVMGACLILRPIGGWQFRLFVLGGGFALVLMTLHRFDQTLSRAAVLRPLDFCGKMCYSMYLVHAPLTKLIGHLLYLQGIRSVTQTMLVTVPLATAVSILVAWVFYNLVERHFLNPPSSIASQTPVSASAGVKKGRKFPVVQVDDDVKVNEGRAIPEIVPTR